jgi:hypothetical protein
VGIKDDSGAAMFTKTIAGVGISLACFVSLGCSAQETDLESMKCSQFLSGNQDTRNNIMYWLSGYYTYEDDPPIINGAKLKSKEIQLKQYCADNQDLPLLDASEIFLDKKYNK